MNPTELSGYLAAGLVFLTFYMQTMIPLRIVGICANVAFIIYGYLNGLYPVLVLHLGLLPLNSLRLRQMLHLTRQVRLASRGDLNMEWVKPFAVMRNAQANEVLFSKGEEADNMFVAISGRYALVESGIEIAPTQIVGEFAFLAPSRKRTQTLRCVESGTLLQLAYNQVEQLFFQNPKFGFFFLRLITARLFQNIDRLESEITQLRGT
jgi:CRP-like cAMP-binding protein